MGRDSNSIIKILQLPPTALTTATNLMLSGNHLVVSYYDKRRKIEMLKQSVLQRSERVQLNSFDLVFLLINNLLYFRMKN